MTDNLDLDLIVRRHTELGMTVALLDEAVARLEPGSDRARLECAVGYLSLLVDEFDDRLAAIVADARSATCPECLDQLPADQLPDHRARMHGEMVCELCGQRFPNEMEMRRHRWPHDGPGCTGEDNR